MMINTNGVISWTPSEAQGPGTNIIITVVTDTNPDAVNTQHLSSTNSFTIVVNEVNSAPILSLPADQTIHAGTRVALTATASDADNPPNNLLFALVSAPVGIEVGTKGEISWATGDSVAGTTNQIRIRVTDDGIPSLSDTQFFQITVVSRPWLAAPVLSNDTASISWSAIPGTSYRLQFSTNLNPSAWLDIAGEVMATTNSADKSDAFQGTRFYRVQVLH
jgi:hypothetical protein